MDIIMELDEKHLEQMQIPLGHKLKIMKKIKDVRVANGHSTSASASTHTTQSVETKPFEKQDLVELPPPSKKFEY